MADHTFTLGEQDLREMLGEVWESCWHYLTDCSVAEFDAERKADEIDHLIAALCSQEANHDGR